MKFYALITVLLAACAANAERQPNVVLILADDLGWSDLGCYGSTFYETPNIDGLARTGVRFTDAYATCPVCSPSRASVMTGKYPARLGMTAHVGDAQPEHWRRDTPLKPAPYVANLPRTETTLAERFHDAGYATMHAGKWHLGGEHYWPEYQGFDINIGGWSQGGPFGGKQFFAPYGNPRLRNGPDGEYLPERLGEEVASFIDAHRHEPFFIHYAPYLVHVPLQARKELLKKYEAKRAQLPAQDSLWLATPDAKVRARQDLPVYAAMVEALDQAVGRVLAQLEKAGVAENTIVVFTSDNGGLATGDHGIPADQGWPTTNHPLRAGKGWLYEGGVREPLIVRAPGVSSPGSTSDHVVTGTDFYPTLLELAGIQPGGRPCPDCKSFAPVLQGDPTQRGPVYWHYPHYGNQGGRPGGAVRDAQWKLIEWYTADETVELELYNLQEDIGETVNLAEEHSDQRERLYTLLQTWRAELDAKMPTPNDSQVREGSIAQRPGVDGDDAN